MKPTVLVIDDNKDLCHLIMDLLAAVGYRVVTATDPVRGVQIARREKPDVVLLDLKMPRMNGIQALRAIKETDKTSAVIILTGYATMDSVRRAMRLDAFDYMTKPLDMRRVLAAVAEALAVRRGARIARRRRRL